jgi:hypothetical protein
MARVQIAGALNSWFALELIVALELGFVSCLNCSNESLPYWRHDDLQEFIAWQTRLSFVNIGGEKKEKDQRLLATLNLELARIIL